MMRTTKCRACGAEIGFIKTVAGKTMPVNPDCDMYIPNPKGPCWYVTPDGYVKNGFKVNEEKDGVEFGYTSHFATCPEADKFRKPRKKDGRKG